MQRLIILTFIILIYSTNGFSCDCDGDYTYDSEFYYCDVVLSGKVQSVFDQTKDSYKINIEINTIFKGDSISEFLVYSIPENFEVLENGDTLIYMSDCDIYLRVGEEWLIYAEKNSQNMYCIDYCSPTKSLNEVSKTEFDFLNYQKSLITTDNTEYYNSKELDNTDLISLSIRGYSLICNQFFIKDLKRNDFELNLKIDKTGHILYDERINKGQERIIGEIKKFEPFIPGTKSGEIVNSEYRVMIKQK